MKYLFTMVLAALSLAALGQKGQLRTIPGLLEDGNLIQAHKVIDKVVAHEKTMGDPKAWLYRAQIYADIVNSKTTTLVGIDEKSALETALSSLARAQEIGTDGLSELLATTSTNIIVPLHMAGTTAFNEEEDYEKAIKMITKKQELWPYSTQEGLDTIGIYVLGLAHQRLDDEASSIPYFEQLSEMNFESANVYVNLMDYYEAEGKDDKYLATTEKARVLFPTENYFLNQEIGYYRDKGEMDVLMNKLHSAVDDKPDDVLYKVVLAQSYRGMEDTANAKIWFDKAEEQDPDNVHVVVGIAAHYINLAAAQQKIMNFEPSYDTAKYKEAESTKKSWVAQAKPYVEKLAVIAPDNADTWRVSEAYYKNAGDAAKAAEFSAKLGN